MHGARWIYPPRPPSKYVIVKPMLFYCWASVVGAGPALKQIVLEIDTLAKSSHKFKTAVILKDHKYNRQLFVTKMMSQKAS